MSIPPEKSANVIPIDFKKRGKSLPDIQPFPYDPKTLDKISKIAAIEDNNVRAQHCVFAGINAEHEDGRRLLKSCCRGHGPYQELCRLRLEMFIDMRRLDSAALRRQFSKLVDAETQSVIAGRRLEYLDDRLYLLCNFLRNDATAMPFELCTTLEAIFDAADLVGPWLDYGVSSFAEAARWARGWLEPIYPADFFDLPEPVT